MSYDDAESVRDLARKHNCEVTTVAMRNTHLVTMREFLISRNLSEDEPVTINRQRHALREERRRQTPKEERLTAAQWREILAHYERRCAYCGALGPLQKEHRIPLVRGGRDSADNIVPACPECNRRKADMTDDVFRVIVGWGDAYLLECGHESAIDYRYPTEPYRACYACGTMPAALPAGHRHRPRWLGLEPEPGAVVEGSGGNVPLSRTDGGQGEAAPVQPLPSPRGVLRKIVRPKTSPLVGIMDIGDRLVAQRGVMAGGRAWFKPSWDVQPVRLLGTPVDIDRYVAQAGLSAWEWPEDWSLRYWWVHMAGSNSREAMRRDRYYLEVWA
jgi:5-methylcytosine-specific restriction endonuclease McrA